MNRKKKAKVDKIIAAEVAKLHVFDDPNNWLLGDFAKPPWPQDKIDAFQKRLNSVFEAENGMVLAWSGDRKYGEVFLNEKGEPEYKPALLFAEHQIEGTQDYVYVSCPRWLIMEAYHVTDAEWEASAFVVDEHGAKMQIRPEKQPKCLYRHFKVIADHNGYCCERMNAENRVCYGKYREPSDLDIKMVGQTRENMNKAGVYQRNDGQVSTKAMADAEAQTKYFIKRSQQQKAQHIQNVMMENYEVFFDDILKDSKLSPNEIRGALQEGFDKQNDRRFA